MGEGDSAEIGPHREKFGPQQGEVVVVDQDSPPVGRHLGDPIGEETVVVTVGMPGFGPVPVGAGPAGGVEQMVVAEPEGGVGDHVVGHLVERRVGLEELEMQPGLVGHSLGNGHPVGRTQATQGAPVPVTSGWRDPAMPPADTPATGWPSSTWNERGPRFETITVSAREWSPRGAEGTPAMPRRYPVGRVPISEPRA